MTRPVIDVHAVRSDTPGCLERAHFNSAGAALPPQPVLATVVDHLRLEARLGGYEAAAAARGRLEAVYGSIASLLGCERDEICLFENATRAFNAVLYALPLARGDRLLTSRSEYCANYMSYLHLARTRGIEIVVAPDDQDGQVDLEALEQRIDARTRLLALTYIPTSGGLVNPVAAVGQLAQAAGVPFLLDACQAVGQLPVDVRSLGCDFLSATGRKFLRGPRGTGFAYVRRERVAELHPATMDYGGAEWTRLDGYTLRDDARRFETFEASQALRLGLGRAVDYALDLGLPAIWSRVSELADTLRRELDAIPGVTQHDRGATRCGIVTFSVDGVSGDQVQRALHAGGVDVGLSLTQNTRLDLQSRALDRFLRASVHYYNDHADIQQLCDTLQRLAEARRNG